MSTTAARDGQMSRLPRLPATSLDIRRRCDTMGLSTGNQGAHQGSEDPPMQDLSITVGGVTYVTVALAARETGVKESTIREWMAARAVETIERKCGKSTRVLVRLGAVRYLR